jgi:hypothetical protein
MLPRLQEGYARVIAGYLRAALEATAETSRQSDGSLRTELIISRAMKLATGDGSLTTTQAADLIKRLLALCPPSLSSLLDDEILKQAHTISLDLRPRKQRSK